MFWLCVISGPVGLILGFVVLCPLLVWNDIKYLPTEHCCFVPFLYLHGIIWAIGNVYGFPVLALLLIHFRVTIFIHHQSNNLTLIMKRRQEREI